MNGEVGKDEDFEPKETVRERWDCKQSSAVTDGSKPSAEPDESASGTRNVTPTPKRFSCDSALG